MGGGVSLMEGVEELVTTTILIGRAISSMTFPGMYRIYDFHSKLAPKLKNARSFTFFSHDSDEENEEEGEQPPDPAVYSHFFHVNVNGDEIYIEDPLKENEAGWTPLHACCMSLSTVSAGLALIDEVVRRGGSFEVQTKVGPGTFNKGWTPLQMACAYGIDALADKLVEMGADVNARNCYGFSCLHEACHRGYADIVKSLLSNGKVDLSYLPPDESTSQSPFASAPAQTALGEAARCGFFRIVQLLLDAGAPKDSKNRLGWTALHEACFYHRIETVKTLLLAGADATLRTNKGALPYHLAGLQDIGTMLQEIGGDAAVPREDESIDMVDILTELAMLGEPSSASVAIGNGDESGAMSGSRLMPVIVIAPRDTSSSAPQHKAVELKREDNDNDEKGGLLYNGAVLGELPHLNSSSPQKTSSSGSQVTPSTKADEKSKKKKSNSKKSREVDVPPDMPKQYLCQLTCKPMSDPVKTPYGNYFDRTAITQWITQQGRICPLTGAPLAESDLIPQEELAAEIRQWLLKKSLAKTLEDSTTDGVDGSPVRENGLNRSRNQAGNVGGSGAAQDDDLYDF